MKKMENFLRRALSMLLSLCMLFGNMGGVLAESVPSVVSESTGTLLDHIQFGNEGITTELSLTYLGGADRVWNGSAYYDADNLNLWYYVDVKVTKDADQGYLQSVGFNLESSENITGSPKVFLYRANTAAGLNNATPLGSEYQLFSQVDNGTKVQVKASNYGAGGYGMPQGVYRFMIGLPVSDSKTVDMLKNGSSVTVKAGNVSVNNTAGSNTDTREHTASFAAPTVTKTAKVVKVSNWYGTNTYLRWTVHYKSDIKMHNTVFTDTTSAGTYEPYKYGNTINQIESGQNAVQAYEHNELISGNEKIDGNTITFTLNGENEYSANADKLRKLYTTDAKLVYYVRLPNGVAPEDVISTYTLEPNGYEQAAISGKANAAGNIKDVTVQFLRSENGGEPALMENTLANGGLWAVMTDKNDKTGAKLFIDALDATGTTGVYSAQLNYDGPHSYLRLTTDSKASVLLKDGDTVQLDADGNGVLNYKDLFVVDIDDNGGSAEITLTNYVKVPVSVSFRRSTADGETDALLTSGNAPKLFAVMLDDNGNAVSQVVELNGTNANGLLGYSGDLYPTGNSNGKVALLTLKDNQQYNATFSADLYNVCENGGTVAVNMDGQNGNAPTDFFAATYDVDAASGATHITLLNSVETENVTLKVEQYDETTKTYSSVTPYNSSNPNLYLAYIDADGNAYSKVTNLTHNGNGVYTAQVERYTGAESDLNVLVRKKENEGPENNYYTPASANKLDRYYDGKLVDNTVPVECTGPVNNTSSLSMDEFFRMTVTEDANGTTVQLVNDRASALQGLVDAYNGGKLEVNEDTGSFEDYDGGKYFNELSPIGIAGSFHIVAFDTANLEAHTNGNVLANVLNAYSNFGTNGYDFELSYVVDYNTVHTTSASKPEHILALGAGNSLAVSEQGGALNVGVNGVRIAKPSNVIIDKDADHPFIDIGAVENQVRGLSATLASNNQDIGISEEFNGSYKYLRLISNSGAGYYNMHASDLAKFGSDLRLAFSDQNKGSIVMNIDCSGMTEINMPERALVNINGQDQGTSEVTTFENGKVIWNFINCEGATINVKQTTGMILAPGATVNLLANVNGTVIGDTINVKAESHRTDFTGTITKTTGAFEAVKQVNGKTPSADEKFTFVLEQKAADGTWTEIERVQNNGSQIKFSDITFDVEGVYTYRFRELGEGAPEGYQTSGEVYYMEVKVYSSTTQLGDKAFGKEYRRWKEGSDGSSCDFIFHNSKATADLLLVKKDSKNETKVLEGAVFEVWQGDVKKATFTTNDQGRVYLSGLENGTYTLKEVTAPFGYELPEVAEWTFTKNDDTYTLGGTYENAILGGTELTINNDGVSTKEIYVRKTWTDNNNQNGNRPDSITVVLLAGGTEYARQTITPNAMGDWEYTFTDLPVYDEQNKEIEYTVQELAVPCYNTSINGYTINNFEKLVGLSGQKSWQNDSGYESLIRPESITVRLYADGQEIKSATVSAASNWRYSFEDLPEYVNKKIVTYTVEEDPVPGYKASRNNNDFINTLITTKVEGTKTWKDEDNLHGLRPASITINLLKTVNGETTVFRTTSVSESNGWAWSWTGLPTKELKNGTYYDVTYAVEEIAVPGYVTEETNTGLENTLETIDINGTKTWTDASNAYETRPESIVIHLVRNNEEYKTDVATAADNWAWSFEYLPKYDADGNEYAYTFYEENVYGYEASYDQANYSITNKLQTTDLSGVKTWDDQNDLYGLRPESVIIKVMNGTKQVAEVETNAAKQWVWSVTGLPKYDKNTGVAIAYSVDEEPSANYIANIDDLAIENTLVTTNLSGTKTWVGDTGFEDVTRPAKITITATSEDGTISKSVDATAANNWEWSITDLPKYDADGKEIVYIVTEADVVGYDEDVVYNEETDTYEVINTVITTDVSVTKVWEDDKNSQNTRPVSIQVVLTANTKQVGDAIVLDEENDWAYTWTKLPEKDAAGYLISYKVDEVSVPAGYVKGITGSQTTGYTITNIYVFGAKAIITAQKTLESINALEEGQFSFQLKDKDGKVLETVKNDAAGNVAFTAIEYDAAGEYTYTITEVNEGADGYSYDESVYTVTVSVTQDSVSKQLSTKVTYAKDDADVDAAAFKNTYTLKPVEITIPVTKVVNGTEGKTKVPDYNGAYTFTLKDADGTVLDSTTNTADTVSFKAIKYTQADAGKTFTYTVTETGFVSGIVNDTTVKTVTVKVSDDGKGNLVTDLESNTAPVTFTNTYTTIDLNGEKVWEGDDDYAHIIRPEAINLTVMDGNGNTVKALEVKPDENGSWSWSVTELPKFDAQGNQITYSVTEEKVNGYTTSQSVAADGIITITNTMDTVNKDGTKNWLNDSDNQYNTRPESITIAAMNGSVKVAETVAVKDNNWVWRFTGLPKFDKNGAEIVYTFVETPVSGYMTEVLGNVINNTLETVDVNVNKVWDDEHNIEGLRPATITINLLKQVGDGEAEIFDTQTISGNKTDSNWAYSWLALPKYENGELITYTITEEAVDNYESDVQDYDVVNSRIVEYIDIPVSKIWEDENNAEGFQPKTISVQLKADGKNVGAPVELSEANDWKYTFTDLIKYQNGAEVDYTVDEVSVPAGYTKLVAGDKATGFVITNTHIVEYVELSGTKNWNDANDQDGFRPEDGIVLVLTENGIATGNKITVTGEGNSWNWNFGKLLKHKDGKEVVYGVQELTVDGYEVKTVEQKDENGNITVTITNTHEPEITSVEGTKRWNDDGNRDNLRPESITIKLMADGNAALDAEGNAIELVVTGEDDLWDWKFTNLPKYAAGKEISYTVEEVVVGGYTSSKTGYNIVNTHEVEKTQVAVTKVWKDSDNQDGLRPKNIYVQLLADGTPVGAGAQLNDGNKWATSWTNLPKNDQGEAIKYTVVETGVPAGYHSDVELVDNTNGTFTYTITNTYNPAVTEVSVTKEWDDANNQDGIRPASITFQLWQTIEEVTGTEPYATVTTTAADWNYTFKNLPVKADGKEITYTVTETVVPGYKDPVVTGNMKDGFTVTNSYVPATTEVTATKVWSDASNQDGFRPTSITFHLMADGNKVAGQSKTLSGEDDTWTVTWTGLPLKANGEVIKYTVEEEVSATAVAAGYTVSNDGLTVTNSYVPKKTQVPVRKAWEDAGNQDGLRPGSVTVTLLANGKEVAGSATVLNADNNWAHTWTDLDMYKDGSVINYTVAEVAVANYSTEVTGSATSGYVITNTHLPIKTEVSGEKHWNDQNDHDGFRPEAITIKLKANGEEIKTITVTEADDWKWNFTGLDKYEGGKEIIYSIEEVAVPGYTTTYDDYDVTNSYTPGKVNVSGNKTWNDANNQDGFRPKSITISLYADNVDTGKSVTVTETDGWKWNFTDLDEFKDGKAIVYTVVETLDAKSVEAGYTVEYDGYNVINNYTTKKVDIYGEKDWQDANDQDGFRPDDITITLYADGEIVKDSEGKDLTATVTPDADGKWMWSFTGLDKYKGGKEIVYSFVETEVPEYDVTYSGDTDEDPDTITIVVTNTHEPETVEIGGTKTWDDDNNRDGIRPDEITITLYAGDKVQDTITVSGEGNSWSWSFGELPVYADGERITYTIKETGVPTGYTSKTTGNAENGFEVTNTHTPETIKIEGIKSWNDNENQDGKRPGHVVINLLADDEKIASTIANEASNWEWSFDNLPKYLTGSVKQLIKYTITEEPVDEYDTQITGSVEAGFTVTNTHEPETTEVSGSKVWNDKKNQDGKRPASITIRLLANGKEVAVKNVTEADGWKWSFTDLPVYSNGTKLIYTISEDPITDYTSQIVGFNAINSTDTAETTVSVRKVWVDDNDRDGLQPDDIKVQLSANGTAMGDPVTLNAANNWAYTWSDLDKMANGQNIVYTVDEVSVPTGYTKAITGDQFVGYVITNTHAPEKTELSGTKTWVDNDNQDGIRPGSITIELLANGTKVQEKSFSGTGNTWSWKFDNLNKYDNGAEIVYTVREVVPAGYEVAIEGTAITNTHAPEKTSVEGIKKWNDNENQDGKRPTELIITLYANGSVRDTYTTNADKNWEWSFTGLDKKANGVDIVYTVSEQSIANYEEAMTTENGKVVFTNTHEPEKITIEGAKEWSDAQNQDGIRPTTVTINLIKDGKVIETTTATKDGGWTWSFDDLDKYENGVEIAYTVEEVPVPGYTAAQETKNGQLIITNTHEPEQTELSGTKVWVDDNDRDDVRPDSVTIKLLADGVDTGMVAYATEANGWTWSFTGLDKNKDEGTLIVYTAQEIVPEDYTVAYSNDTKTITNTHELETVDVEGTKTWQDNENQDGKRPAYIVINLLADGKEIDQKTVTADDNWSWSWKGLAKYETGSVGKKIVYTITEDAVPAYEAIISGYDVTNTHNPEHIDLEGSKTWNDKDDQDGKRPTSIQITLLANGKAVRGPINVTADDNWSWKFLQLPKYEKGTEIIYTVAEAAVAEYATVVSGMDVTNSYTPGKTSISGVKVWDDANDQDGIRPDSIVINLMKQVGDGEVTKTGKSVTLNDNTGWNWSFTELDEYEGGKLVTYSVTEDEVKDYTTDITVDEETGFVTITNAYQPETIDLSGEKTWDDADNQDGKRPIDITVHLLADGVEVKNATVGFQEGWKWSFTNLPKYRNGGIEIRYTLTEDAVALYTTTVDGMNVTNTYKPAEVSIDVLKVWEDNNNQDGKRPDDITVQLKADGTNVGEAVTLNAANGWAYEWTKLPKCRNMGTLIKYTVVETGVPADYTPSYSSTTAEDGSVSFVITNTDEADKTSISGTKVWEDANNQDGIRPASITINLLANGKKVDSQVVYPTQSGDWSWKFDNLTKYEGGAEIVYTFTEEKVEGYTTTTNDDTTVITNTHAPETVKVEGSKEWDDADNQDGKRPETITINLLADGKIIKTAVVEADENGDWKWSWDNLPKYEVGQQGKEVVYTVTEEAVAEYTTTIDGYNVKNTHKPTKVTVDGSKTWNDANDQDGLRPETIEIQLYANGEYVASKIVSEGTNNWSWSFTDLDEYKDGAKIVYTIQEVVTEKMTNDGYEAVVDGFNVTNTYAPETLDIVGSKTWDDADDQDGYRPESITIRLWADGTNIQTVTIEPDAEGNWPEWKFEDLPKYRDHGTEIIYKITEDVVDEYTTEIDGWNAINTHEPKTVEVSGAKTWDDADNQDGYRPESITINLLADGEVVDSITVTEEDEWKWSFTNLPWRKAGKDITYTITEDAVAEYTTQINGFSAVNTHITETVDVEGTKTWTDADNQDGKRPAYIIINLLADGTEIDQKTITAEDGWKWSWTGLDKFKNGTEIVYTITEDEVAEYTTQVTGYDVENTHITETVDVEGTKTWNDANDQDDKRPTSITINLLADGEIIDSAVIEPDADGNWPGWKFEDLPKYKVGAQGQLVTYTVTENAVEEYTTEVTGYDVLNSYTPGVTSVSVSKAWNDDNDRDGLRPESIIFNLLADGVEIDEVVITPDADGNWPTYTFTNLPIYEVGKVGHKVTYTVTEEPVAAYETSFTGDAATGYYYTNTHEIETVEVSGAKTWTDANDQDGLRPVSITINLLADGAVIDTATVTEAEGWSWSFTDLPKYRDQGEEIVYTITEDAVAEYTTVITGYDVENIHQPETVEVSGAKTWIDADNQDGKRPTSITINLLADGAVIDTVTVTEAESWSWSFTDLPKYHDQGIEYTYTITEDAVAEYTTVINGYDVENTHEIELVDVEGTKTWTDADNQDGKRPDYITINLLADGTVIDTVNVTAQESWSWSFTDLPKYKAGEQGVEIVYTITENDVPGYTAIITGYDVENVYTPETVDVTGSKTWTDADNQDGKRPDSITINLLADGEVIQTVIVTEAEGWSWSFTDLPKYKVGAQGKEVTYTITEDEVAEYTTVITGYDVENIYEPETVDVEGTKTWTDAGNQDGKRPDNVTINLLANGEKIDFFTAAADDNWSWSWLGLPKYENGVEIVYTITEEPVAEYTSVITGYNAENIYEPELISIEGTKTWADAENQDGVRPESIIIKLMDGSTVVETVTVTEADGWKWTFTDLPKYRPGAVGELMVYTVVEELDAASAAQYTATVDGYNVTNTHEVETVEISGSKIWEDYNNKYLMRPDSITIRLYADGVEIAKAVVTAEENWSWSFEDLPKYKAGAQGVEIAYTIAEDAVNGYITEVEGYNVRNTITLVEFVKVDEQTGKRLAGAKFALYEGGADTVGQNAPIQVWTSDLNAKVLAGLKVGQTYTIVETEAPAGFALMAPFVFTVELTDVPASYRTFSAGNAHIYRFRKLDSSNNGLVSGAQLAVLEGNAVIESWYTGTDNDGWYELTSSALVPGVVYTLAELEVPAGYLQAAPINFTIDANDGLLIVNGVDTNAAEIVMYDAPAPQVTPTPEPTTESFTVTKRWEDKGNVLGLRPSTITVHLFRKLRTDAEYPADPFMTVQIADNGKNVWKFTFRGLPRRNEDGVRYQYLIREEEVPGYVVTYLNNGRTIVNTIPEEDYPPTPTPTLPVYTPTPAPTQRAPQGVKFVDGEWFYIDEYGIPLGGVPMTGDETNFILWGMAIGLPLLVAVLAAVEIRRRKKLLACAEQDEEVETEE